LIAAKSLQLTDQGRELGLNFLGVDKLPPRVNWKTVRTRYLVERALAVLPKDEKTRKRIQKAEILAALLLREKFSLSPSRTNTLRQVFEALVCQNLGFSDLASFSQLQDVILNRIIKAPEPLSGKQLKKQVPRILLETSGGTIDAFRDVLLKGWIDPDPEEHADTAFDLPVFAKTIKTIARDCSSGRFGHNKVFINHVWRRLQEEPGLPPMDLATFKQRLVEANVQRLLTLSRADLVQVMNPTDVRESETPYLNSVFHFILLEDARP
jgi:hypothetical protein